MFTIVDKTYGNGRVGFRVHPNHLGEDALVSLSVTPGGALTTRDTSEPVNEPVTDHERIVADRQEFGWQYHDSKYLSLRNQPPEPTSAGFRIDRSFKNPEMVADLLKAYASRFPTLARVETLGKSHQGRRILALKVSDNVVKPEDQPAVLLSGGHHGDELLSTEFVLDAVQVLLESYAGNPQIQRLVNSFEIWCVPLVNPDGTHLFLEESTLLGRKNARDHDQDGRIQEGDGVDLNRNYPFRWGALGESGSRSWPLHWRYRGQQPASEPETRALMALARRERFTASISYHTANTVILAPYTIDGVENPVPNEAWIVAQEIANRLPTQPNGRRYAVKRKIYSVDGTDQDWLRASFGTVALLIEGALHNPESEKQRRLALEATRPSWIALLERFLDGPTLAGHVRDENQRPLSAEIHIREQRLRAAEKWTSRPRDGWFGRFLPGAGEYTVCAELRGYRPVEKKVSARDGVSQVELVMSAASPSTSSAGPNVRR